jgi:tetratricopeptide (TPR) repeat protein
MFGTAGKLYAQQNDEQLGVQYYQNKEFDKAEALFEDLFERNPSLLNYIYYVNSILELKDYDKAEKVVKRQSRAYPADPRYDVDLGYISILRGDSQKGKKAYEQCIKDLRADKSQIYNLANAFQTRRETDYAVRTYQRGREY